ncbi:MAG TPA: hypothetical protein VFV17_10745 [Usitatibacteraceae bacterium]|nr:hypothetical protein [Usitatibacteraceae bacterium]
MAIVAAGAHAALDFEEYLERAEAARKRGDWEAVASQYAEAINHRDLPKDAAVRVEVHREYGRAMGALCQFGEAEKFLMKARAIAGADAALDTRTAYELGSLALATRRFEVAMREFQTFLEAPRTPAAVAPPRLMADALEKLARAQEALGKAEEAARSRERAAPLNGAAAKPLPPGSITPYGLRCASAQGR